MSLRHRVVVAFIAVALVLVGTNVLLSATLRSFMVDRLDQQVIGAAQALAGRPAPRGPVAQCLALGANRAETVSEYSIACLDRRDGVLYRYPSPFRDDRPALDTATVNRNVAVPGGAATAFTADSESGNGRWRVVALRSPTSGNAVIVAVPMDQLTATLRRIRALQVLASGAVLVALGVLSWWMIRLGVHPIEAMAKTAEEIAAGDLSKRVDRGDSRTEAGRLALSFNTMLERITDAFRAREASESRVRRFAADASHELRTPLTSIRGYAELWRAGGLRDERELAEAMRRMEGEATRMGELVEDLLLLARLDQHRPLDRHPVRLDHLAEDSVRDAQAVEPSRTIDVHAEPVTVAGDEARLRQVIGNLLANARLHTPPTSAVHVRVRAVDGQAVLEVADEGPGMAPDVAEKVFERFYRADTSRSRAAGGTGLGLSIVDAIAQAHGGRASVRSDVGRGSTFTIELPAVAS